VKLSMLDKLSPFFATKTGRKVGSALFRLVGIDKANKAYEAIYQYKGPAFARKLLEYLEIQYKVAGLETLENQQDGSFITISNHVYGGLDGLVLMDLVFRRFPDFKVMVNHFLTLMEPLDDNFISVDPKTDISTSVTSRSLNGVREALAQIRDRRPVGFFPSGAVSDFHFKDWLLPWTQSLEVRNSTAYSQRNRAVYDRPWQDSVVRIIRKAQVPVIPIRFFDRNSMFFYSLGLIDWRVRVMRLPRESFNKKGKEMRIAIGRPITPEEIRSHESIEDLSLFLRRSVYGMPIPDSYEVIK